MILDEEKPPPPYTHASALTPTPSYSSLSRRRTAGRGLSLPSLPAYILLQIVYATCPPDLSLQDRRLALYWMAHSLRYVCRDMYIASMHVLRSSYLPLYARKITPPYTTDPFPPSSPSHLSSLPASASTLRSTQRETAILDLFILLKVKEDVRADESDLYMDSADEQYRDMFNLMQPRARLEDLVRKYGTRANLITSPSSSRTSSSRTDFKLLSITWANRSVALARVDPSQGNRKRALVEIGRDKGDTLESLARRLVRAWEASVSGSSARK